MAIEIELVAQPKGRPPRWRLRVSNPNILFDDAWVALRFQSEAAAHWLGELIIAIHERGGNLPRRSELAWHGDLDDATFEDASIYAHAEHLEGPLGKGGTWYCQVQDGDQTLFHSVDSAIQPRSCAAARWLCEAVILARNLGVQAKQAAN